MDTDKDLQRKRDQCTCRKRLAKIKKYRQKDTLPDRQNFKKTK